MKKLKVCPKCNGAGKIRGSFWDYGFVGIISTLIAGVEVRICSICKGEGYLKTKEDL